MRRGMILILTLLVACAAFAEGASAEPRNFPDALFGIITKPIGAILGTVRRIGRPPVHRPPAPIPSRSASTGTPPGNTAAEARVPDTKTANTAAIAAPAAAAGAAASTAAASSNIPPTTAAVPIPAPRQHSAALTAPADEQKNRGRQPARPARDARQGNNNAPLGQVGPLAWPAAYEDVIGFTLWPKTYAQRLRTHGITDVLTTIFAPNAAPGAQTEVAQAGADKPNRPAAMLAAASACNNSDEAAPDWPTAQIKSSIELTAEQRKALDQLKSAVAKAVAAIKATCRNENAAAPIERLQAMQDKLWAVRDAAILVRAPLAKFMDSLTADQKKQFAAPPSQTDPRALAAAGRQVNREALARMCGMPSMNASSLQPIERTLQPTKDQHASLEALQKTSIEMGQLLIVSCLQPTSATPAERLDTAIDRLTAVLFAASNINLAFNDFYNQLSTEQKTKLEAFAR
jgi:LTXXQ motif family protein